MSHCALCGVERADEKELCPRHTRDGSGIDLPDALEELRREVERVMREPLPQARRGPKYEEHEKGRSDLMTMVTVVLYVFLELSTGTLVGYFDNLELCKAIRADVAKKVGVEPSLCWQTPVQVPVRPPR